jgi:hypothetical protein
MVRHSMLLFTMTCGHGGRSSLVHSRCTHPLGEGTETRVHRGGVVLHVLSLLPETSFPQRVRWLPLCQREGGDGTDAIKASPELLMPRGAWAEK